jgi:diaminohydroxyphosphoribosylaminopyrimidine deaminase/5-amino-6-(5-phosphoribosylamino)uracil reductase
MPVDETRRGELEGLMDLAMAEANRVRASTSPNPWVGAVVISSDGAERYFGATEAPGGRHAEVVALEAAGPAARGGTLVVTLEPCSHRGRTGPCVEAIATAGIATCVLGMRDPDPLVDGQGVQGLKAAGIEVLEAVRAHEVAEQLSAYLHHRRTGHPQVVLKLATTLDGRIAAADGSSRWITSAEARADVHRLRAEADAILVGAGTVRADDPSLTARTDPPASRQPLRVVLGAIPEGAAVEPAISMSGPIPQILDDLGARGILQVLVEGGASVAHSFVQAGLVDRVVLYLAPALMGGDDGAPVLRGPGAASIEAVRRGRFVSVTRLGDDLRMEVQL